MEDTYHQLLAIAGEFVPRERITALRPHGKGHINDTYLVEARTAADGWMRWILQRINRNVFHRPEEVMENIEGVTAHLRRKVRQEGGEPEREVLRLIPTLKGRAFCRDGSGRPESCSGPRTVCPGAGYGAEMGRFERDYKEE